jgi:hypothetical protein
VQPEREGTVGCWSGDGRLTKVRCVERHRDSGHGGGSSSVIHDELDIETLGERTKDGRYGVALEAVQTWP